VWVWLRWVGLVSYKALLKILLNRLNAGSAIASASEMAAGASRELGVLREEVSVLVLRVCSQMQRHGVSPDLHIYTLLFRLWSALGEWRRVSIGYRMMRSAAATRGRALHSMSSDSTPDEPRSQPASPAPASAPTAPSAPTASSPAAKGPAPAEAKVRDSHSPISLGVKVVGGVQPTVRAAYHLLLAASNAPALPAVLREDASAALDSLLNSSGAQAQAQVRRTRDTAKPHGQHQPKPQPKSEPAAVPRDRLTHSDWLAEISRSNLRRLDSIMNRVHSFVMQPSSATPSTPASSTPIASPPLHSTNTTTPSS
jgi:hypothetical protein